MHVCRSTHASDLMLRIICFQHVHLCSFLPSESDKSLGCTVIIFQSMLPLVLQAWMINETPVTHHQFMQSAPKVHSGFHAAWDISGLKAAVLQLLKDKIQPETALNMHVLLTGTYMHPL